MSIDQLGLMLSAFLFSAGLLIAITKKNMIFVLIGVELILNAANLNLVIFSRSDPNFQGQMVALFTVVVGAAEIALALAIIFRVYKAYQTSDLDQVDEIGN